MYNTKTNSITFCKNKYKSEQDWKQAISDAVILLLNAEYIMTVRYDEKGLGIVVIEYQHDKQEYGCAYPYWLEPEEIETIVWKDEEE